MSIAVIPVTTGEGVISGFSESVVEILQFLGFSANVTSLPDIGGINEAYCNNADAIFMADDNHYVAINLNNKTTEHNNNGTGKVYAATLDLLASDSVKKEAVVIGCGPIGEIGASALLDYGFSITLFDSNPKASALLLKKLQSNPSRQQCGIAKNLETVLATHSLILEATPSDTSIPDHLLRPEMRIAAPGVPSAITPKCRNLLGNHAIHDKLELGTAAMAVALLQ